MGAHCRDLVQKVQEKLTEGLLGAGSVIAWGIVVNKAGAAPAFMGPRVSGEPGSDHTN